MVVLNAVIILLLFEPRIISGRAFDYYSSVSCPEANPCEPDWNYDSTTHTVAIKYCDTKTPPSCPCIPSYAKKLEKEYQPKQGPCCPCPPNEPCCCKSNCKPCCKQVCDEPCCKQVRNEPCCKQVCFEPCCKQVCKEPCCKSCRERYCRPCYEAWRESCCQPTSRGPLVKKTKEDVDPNKFLANLLQLPLIIVDGIFERER